MELNCIQKLFIKGGPYADCLEKTADNILAFPRYLWSDFDQDIDNNYTYRNRQTESECIAYVCIMYVLATPFLLIGAILKKYVLCTDPDAKFHNICAQGIIYNIANQKN